jgi:acetoin utilization deacetylase AcuC-like enzyme
MVRRTGFVWHEAYAWFDLGNHAGFVPPDGKSVQPDRHAYDPEVPRRIRNLLEMSGLADRLVHLKPRPATEAELRRVHASEHVEQIRALSALPRAETPGTSRPFLPVHSTLPCSRRAGPSLRSMP